LSRTEWEGSIKQVNCFNSNCGSHPYYLQAQGVTGMKNYPELQWFPSSSRFAATRVHTAGRLESPSCLLSSGIFPITLTYTRSLSD